VLAPLRDGDGYEVATHSTVESSARTVADPSHLQQLFGNRFRNAVEHSTADSPTVRVGRLLDGFYVVDDGPGIPESEREQVFESGYTTSDAGTGFGLRTVSLAESESGGARFEMRGFRLSDR